MSTIYLIRHGQASMGKPDYDVLSPVGVQQAGILGKYFICNGVRFDAIYSGNMKRHIDTAAGYYSACESAGIDPPALKRIEGLNEYDSKGILTRLIPLLLEERPSFREYTNDLFGNKKTFQIVFDAVMDMWASGRYDMGALPSWKNFCGGVVESLQEIMKENPSGKTVGVFTSGGPISAAARYVLQLNDEITMRVRDQIVNSSFSQFKCTSDRIMISTFNGYPHLESGGASGMVTYR